MEARNLGVRKLSLRPGKANRRWRMGHDLGLGLGPRRRWTTSKPTRAWIASRVGIMGITRLGKTVLWAGANIRDRPGDRKLLWRSGASLTAATTVNSLNT